MTGLLETIKGKVGEAAQAVDHAAQGAVRAVAAAGEGAEHAAATAFHGTVEGVKTAAEGATHAVGDVAHGAAQAGHDLAEGARHGHVLEGLGRAEQDVARGTGQGLSTAWNGAAAAVGKVAQGDLAAVNAMGRGLGRAYDAGVDGAAHAVGDMAGKQAGEAVRQVAEAAAEPVRQGANLGAGIVEGVGRGAGALLHSTGDLVVGTVRVGTDAQYRDRLIQKAEKVAGAVGHLAKAAAANPGEAAHKLGQAVEGTVHHVLQDGQAAAKRGDLAHWVGQGLGRAGFEAATFLVAPAKAGEAASLVGKAGKLAEGLADAGRAAEATAKVGAKAGEAATMAEDAAKVAGHAGDGARAAEEAGTAARRAEAMGGTPGDAVGGRLQRLSEALPGAETDASRADAAARLAPYGDMLAEVNNLHGVATGFKPSLENCVQCAATVERRLATGLKLMATQHNPHIDVGKLDKLGTLDRIFDTKFGPPIAKSEIERRMLAEGEGTRGVVVGLTSDEKTAHVWNAVVHKESSGELRVRYLDGQSGLDGTQNFYAYNKTSLGITGKVGDGKVVLDQPPGFENAARASEAAGPRIEAKAGEGGDPAKPADVGDAPGTPGAGLAAWAPSKWFESPRDQLRAHTFVENGATAEEVEHALDQGVSNPLNNLHALRDGGGGFVVSRNILGVPQHGFVPLQFHPNAMPYEASPLAQGANAAAGQAATTDAAGLSASDQFRSRVLVGPDVPTNIAEKAIDEHVQHWTPGMFENVARNSDVPFVITRKPDGSVMGRFMADPGRIEGLKPHEPGEWAGTPIRVGNARGEPGAVPPRGGAEAKGPPGAGSVRGNHANVQGHGRDARYAAVRDRVEHWGTATKADRQLVRNELAKHIPENILRVLDKDGMQHYAVRDSIAERYPDMAGRQVPGYPGLTIDRNVIGISERAIKENVVVTRPVDGLPEHVRHIPGGGPEIPMLGVREAHASLHEAAHALDKRLAGGTAESPLSSQPAWQEVFDQMKGSIRPPHDKPNEAFAEYLARFFNKPEEVARDAPPFYGYFKTLVQNIDTPITTESIARHMATQAHLPR